ncbi:MAG: sigma-70 family RNA polymerase sigma factor [Gemmatimonadetes bacterium]|nr:sigma-70 family RNA polymerase sigma factor [Gemmatimonadota bacterium]MCA9761685.1 sigma-70 family RNA polymerase sigma factor [Gemmatimonadota bacterium]MCA9769118.1 sigma-70 family RNA polymerase sigma factor [Gemmatimonadota bacterium]MCB9518725.1 sigma-70 family RNA polymerase sigma factor [Gemmatimonadales bacterium]HPF62044.1 sigma-70 family RNA polymerase sigma factor [Gemmatimonadales bacterium]
MSAPPAPARFGDEALPHLDLLYRVALRLTGDPAAAEDLVQDTMLKALRAWGSFRPGSNARAWLVTILRNQFINTWRKRTRRPTAIDLEAIPELGDEDNPDPEGQFFASLVDDEVTRALDALPEEFRDVVLLSDLEGLPYQEVAEALEIPIGTVKSRLFRARRILQGQLRRYAVETGIIRPQEEAQ